MDKGYDNNRVYAECASRKCAQVVPLRKRRIDPGSPIPRHTDRWRALYRGRSAVERELEYLKRHSASEAACEGRAARGPHDPGAARVGNRSHAGRVPSHMKVTARVAARTVGTTGATPKAWPAS